jgi:signal peptidase I
MRSLSGLQIVDLKNEVKRIVKRLSDETGDIIVLKLDFDWELAADDVRNFYKELKEFRKLFTDRYTLNVWGENPVAFFDIGIEYYNLWIKYRIKLIGRLSPLEEKLDTTFNMISAEWQWLNGETEAI